MLDKAMIIHNFNALFSNQDVRNVKPDPEIYIKCMDMLNVKPSETLILEDNDYGIKAALASGANLMRIRNVYDVSYAKIMDSIAIAENQ